MHIFYTMMLILYVKNAYLKESEYQRVLTILLFIGIVYPVGFEYMQLKKMGSANYFGNLSNYSDCIYNWASVVNLLF